ncbi:MAG: hypothetical protein HRU15_07590 [Planctomycetes bacterium]|nr:hypothetical protein [Planctomycetota bacterium]
MNHYKSFFCIVFLFMGSCGGGSSAPATSGSGGGNSSADNSQVLKTYYENGDLESSGSVDHNSLKQGTWKWYYQGGQLQTEVIFIDDIFDESASWIIFNLDGSIRADHTDGAYVFTKPW